MCLYVSCLVFQLFGNFHHNPESAFKFAHYEKFPSKFCCSTIDINWLMDTFKCTTMIQEKRNKKIDEQIAKGRNLLIFSQWTKLSNHSHNGPLCCKHYHLAFSHESNKLSENVCENKFIIDPLRCDQ